MLDTTCSFHFSQREHVLFSLYCQRDLRATYAENIPTNANEVQTASYLDNALGAFFGSAHHGQ